MSFVAFLLLHLLLYEFIRGVALFKKSVTPLVLRISLTATPRPAHNFFEISQ